jgi:SAM-dependent methyltransferase
MARAAMSAYIGERDNSMVKKTEAADIYDQIGSDYASLRKPDPRWTAQIHQALKGQSTLVNIGAGAGSYEPASMSVIGVEPSQTMIRQRPASAAPVVCSIAEALPFADETFDVSMAVLTVHHWSDASAGLAEMRRVSRRQIVVTWDSNVTDREFWLVHDYLPEITERDQPLASLATVLKHLKPATTHILPVPEDCTDGFLGAYWKRPHAYLDPMVRGAISSIALLDPGTVSAAMDRLRKDLDNGSWQQRYAGLSGPGEMDLGYRLVIAGDSH